MTDTPKKKVKKTKSIQANNVIKFPTNDATPEITSIEQIKDNKIALREIHIDETLDAVMPMVFDCITTMGFNFANKVELVKDVNLVFDAVESLLKKYYGMPHHLQKIANQYSIFDDEESENTEE